MAERAVVPEPPVAHVPQESKAEQKGAEPVESQSTKPAPSASEGAAPKWETPPCETEGLPSRQQPMGDGCSPYQSRPKLFDRFRHRVAAEQQVADPRVEQNWVAHPFSAGLFVGSLYGSTLMVNWLEQRAGYLGGVRFGYDFDEYLGMEFRHAFGSCRLVDSDRAWAAAEVVSPGSSEFAQARFSDRQLYEISFLWYPWGGGRWQPFITGGIGIAEVQFQDILGDNYAASVPSIPIGVGVKYHCTDRVVLRAECTDDFVFTRGSGMVDTIHDFSVLLGIEFRFGGSRRGYWPWVPASSAW